MDLVLLTVYIFHPLKFFILSQSFLAMCDLVLLATFLFLGDVMDLVLLTVYITAKISPSQIFHPLTEE